MVGGWGAGGGMGECGDGVIGDEWVGVVSGEGCGQRLGGWHLEKRCRLKGQEGVWGWWGGGWDGGNIPGTFFVRHTLLSGVGYSSSHRHCLFEMGILEVFGKFSRIKLHVSSHLWSSQSRSCHCYPE